MDERCPKAMLVVYVVLTGEGEGGSEAAWPLSQSCMVEHFMELGLMETRSEVCKLRLVLTGSNKPITEGKVK